MFLLVVEFFDDPLVYTGIKVVYAWKEQFDQNDHKELAYRTAAAFQVPQEEVVDAKPA